MKKLPTEINLNTIKILKHLSQASFKLGELNGIVKLLPNPNILLNAILLGESKFSSEIENILTTYDDLYKEMISSHSSQSAKEVLRYRDAINVGVRMINERSILTINDIVAVHHIVEPDKGNIRKLPGTIIKNSKTNEVVYTPPQSEVEIRDFLQNFESYLNTSVDYDPIVNMAILHYQFEAIHPFYDGNGRVGRIINILYLMLNKKINQPIIYLSKYINENRDEYYKLLNLVQEDDKNLEDFVVYMLKAVDEMSVFTIDFIEQLTSEIERVKSEIKQMLPSIYTSELIDALFYDFYTKNELLRARLGISRNTASSYLKKLVKVGLLSETKVGKEVIYKNNSLYQLIEKW